MVASRSCRWSWVTALACGAACGPRVSGGTPPPADVAPVGLDVAATAESGCVPSTEPLVVHRPDDPRYFPAAVSPPECRPGTDLDDPEPPRANAECDEACRAAALDCMAWRQELAVSRLRAWDIARADRRAAEAAGETDRAVALREEEAEARDTATEAVSSAIEGWYALVEGFESAKGTDEALFQLGRSFEYLADLTDDPTQAEDDRFKARTVLNILIRDYPVSDRLAGAWLSFGDAFAEQDDCPRALEVYERVLQLDVPLLRGYTLYRKARCLQNLDRNDEARATLDELWTWLSENPTAVGADELREALCRESPSSSAP